MQNQYMSFRCIEFFPFKINERVKEVFCNGDKVTIFITLFPKLFLAKKDK